MVFLYLISKGCENMEKSLEQLKQEYEKTTVLLELEGCRPCPLFGGKLDNAAVGYAQN